MTLDWVLRGFCPRLNQLLAFEPPETAGLLETLAFQTGVLDGSTMEHVGQHKTGVMIKANRALSRQTEPDLLYVEGGRLGMFGLRMLQGEQAVGVGQVEGGDGGSDVLWLAPSVDLGHLHPEGLVHRVQQTELVLALELSLLLLLSQIRLYLA